MTHHSEQIGDLVAALAKAQAEIENPKRDQEVSYSGRKFRYASLPVIIDTIRKPLTSNAMWFSQMTSTENGKTCLTTKLMHSSGQWLASDTPIETRGPGNQEFGSALTYMKRYALCALLGIAADEDDDGNAGDGKKERPEPRTNQGRATGPDDRLTDEQLPDAITAAEMALESSGVLAPEQIVKARIKHAGQASVEKMSGIGRRSYLSKLQEQLKKVS